MCFQSAVALLSIPRQRSIRQYPLSQIAGTDRQCSPTSVVPTVPNAEAGGQPERCPERKSRARRDFGSYKRQAAGQSGRKPQYIFHDVRRKGWCYSASLCSRTWRHTAMLSLPPIGAAWQGECEFSPLGPLALK